ncbi:MAG: MTH1187 family thiamine-binding protein [Acidobacteriota bacterium]|nr:MTH1187 family thiamine-binding protein [Acidobacteriota bacterium]
MVLELTIIPLGQGRSISSDIAGLVKIIEASGLDYRMTAFGTLIEGTWDQLMDVARHCHVETRKKTERVLTMMRLDDYGERTGEIDGAVDRVEKKLGRPVKK